MPLIEVLDRIAKGFLQARAEPFKEHVLADAIRDEWPTAAWETMKPKWRSKIHIKGSPGLGNWNEAPWLAFFHIDVTSTARAGYYPIFLFEPGFKTYCLVLAQGTDVLYDTFGKTEGDRVMAERASKLRNVAKGWEAAGFSIGPFKTFKRLIAVPNSNSDGWSSSVAFGKRYLVDEPPATEILRRDLANILDIYGRVVAAIGNTFTVEDDETGKLAKTGELPPSGLDGALKVVWHKRVEGRARNGKLAREVKAALGYRCQGCLVDLAETYPGLGKEFIEAHHKQPISEAPPEGVLLTVDDFAVLCPTCHRVIHRMGCPPLDDFIGTVSESLRSFHSKDLTETGRSQSPEV